MATKAAWNERPPSVIVPALPESVAAFLDGATHLSRGDLDRLATADARKRPVVWTAWELLRDRLDRARLSDVHALVKRRSWVAVNASLAALGVSPVPDDYWRIVASDGAGAARAARFAACALIRPDLLDDEVLSPLLEPWRTAFSEPSRRLD